MIFTANVLEMNGGTTFLIRTCKAMRARGRACAVVVLRPGGDATLAKRLAEHAELIWLPDYQRDKAIVMPRHLGAFAPIAWDRLTTALAPYGRTVHVMGAFGLLLAARLASRAPRFYVTVGIYHQNEFLFEDKHFVPQRLMALFRRIPQTNILFFNELSRANYAQFHRDNRYLSSPLVPIGVELPTIDRPEKPRKQHTIVSVGNLDQFKTYNRHVINLLPTLKAAFPGVTYHIYGAGEQRRQLELLARTRHVEADVQFHGRVAYSDLDRVFSETTVFVGSGTALIEAAATGVPALIGIESMQEPLTYGFLSEIDGLSYNELGADHQLVSMAERLHAALGDDSYWRRIAAACAMKAHDFSVDRTVDGIMRLEHDAVLTPALTNSAELLAMLVGLPSLILRDRLWPRAAFARRRNQSFQAVAA